MGVQFRMEARKFYEEYFSNLEVKEPEVEKQITRIERLRREIDALQDPHWGLFVGVGRGAEMTTGKGRLVGLDLPFGQLAGLQQKDSKNLYVSGDGRSLPFANGFFDYVVCSEVIEHIAERSQVLGELGRVLRADGHMILSTPNWWSLYGLARKLYEFVLRREFHADDQPIDAWTSPPAFIEELEPHFHIHRVKGSWYWPPTGKGRYQVVPALFGKLFRMLRPVDVFLGGMLPYFGHSLWITGQPRRGDNAGNAERSFSLLNLPLIRGIFYFWLVFFTFFGFYKGGILQTFRFYLQMLIN
jgi:SAM-dependent methyltransferase